jgi:beta-glucuronidase
MFKKILFLFLTFYCGLNFAQLLTNIDNRKTTSLNGEWNIIIDPYENGYYDYRYMPNGNGYFKNFKQKDKSQLVEYSFEGNEKLNLPGDWNSQKDQLFWYEGTIWYKKSFDYIKNDNNRVFVYFGAVNYEAKVYLNGEYLGEHTGGFTPFNFEVTDLLKATDNFLILKVDNKRLREGVPTLNTDWFNYGGITRRVMLIETPSVFINDSFIQLEKGNKNKIAGWIKINGSDKNESVEIKIPELNITHSYKTNNEGYVSFSFDADPELWSPENPKLYKVVLKSNSDELSDKIGFRTIETKGTDILLNGKPIYLRGISIHEEAPYLDGARAFSKDHARTLLTWAKDLGCNFVRLAHYPHNEFMTRTADEMGLLVWSEIPVYWTILWENEATLNNAKTQLSEMITRDKNRASIILWSMANETPLSDARLTFLIKLVDQARTLDQTRLITAAMERHYINENTQMIDDAFGEYVDVLGCNEYVGWYDGLPSKCETMKWETTYNKPVIISEFGGGALFGNHGDKLTRWTEEFQEDVYIKNIDMLKKVPFIKGMTPWILKDFRSPRRPLPVIQNFWNRKGLMDDNGNKKEAYYILKDFYEGKANE